MSKSAEQIERARRALLTNQPNLAMLYMNAAHESLKKEKFERMSPFEQAVQSLSDSFQYIAKESRRVAQVFVDAFEGIGIEVKR